LTSHLTQFNTLFNDYFETAGVDIDAPNALRELTHSEVSYYDHIFQQPMPQNQDDFNCNKESHVHALLYELGRHVRRVDETQRPCLKL
jgi:hypothetical protein